VHERRGEPAHARWLGRVAVAVHAARIERGVANRRIEMGKLVEDPDTEASSTPRRGRKTAEPRQPIPLKGKEQAVRLYAPVNVPVATEARSQ
jgi:hypothetical protein